MLKLCLSSISKQVTNKLCYKKITWYFVCKVILSLKIVTKTMKFLHAHRSFLFKTEKVYIIEKQDGERYREREKESYI